MDDDAKIILLAAQAWLYEHDMGEHAELMDSHIDRDKLANALDKVLGKPPKLISRKSLSERR